MKKGHIKKIIRAKELLEEIKADLEANIQRINEKENPDVFHEVEIQEDITEINPVIENLNKILEDEKNSQN